jgi:purine-binding chemotaxis protein CheW
VNATETYILFELAGAVYGVCSRDVLHVDMLDHITPVPNSARAVLGVVFSRGQVIPTIDLRARFGFPTQEPTPRTRLLFVRHEQRTVALVVDSAREFRRIPDEAIRPIGDSLASTEGNHVSGVATVGDRLVLLLDVPAVLQFAAGDAPSPTNAQVLQPAT